NRVGFRSTSSVIVRYGDTVVLGTAMVSPETMSGMDYFPLSIEYEEKMYASGKISGSRFIKREGRPSDDAILITGTDIFAEGGYLAMGSEGLGETSNFAGSV
ncbi:MAG: hypothetical protein WCJ54_04575, partial [Actinomycetota bacterium]